MINYEMLHDATYIYAAKGFMRIEAPWLVTPAISDITKPADATNYLVKKDNENSVKTFVASGEQSFLYLINKGHLPDGKYQTVTPCIRNDAFDEFHTKYFLKLELIDFSTTVKKGKVALDFMIDAAMDFYKRHIPDTENLVRAMNDPMSQDTSYDINYRGVEIGSYGVRSCSFCSWVYGTGLAEPRFSRLLKKGCFE